MKCIISYPYSLAGKTVDAISTRSNVRHDRAKYPGGGKQGVPEGGFEYLFPDAVQLTAKQHRMKTTMDDILQ